MADLKFITRQNFNEAFPQFLHDVAEADYIAVDLEFTGIDHSMTADFLKLPQHVYFEKISAARRFTPLQIGFSLFRGDTGLTETTGAAVDDACKASPSCREAMVQEVNAFHPRGVAGEKAKKKLMQVCCSSSGSSVTAEIMAELQGLREEAVRLCVAAKEKKKNEKKETSTTASLMSLYDELDVYDGLNSVDAAIAMAERWKKYTEPKKRHIFVCNYSSYLYPAPGTEENDRTVTLSTETALFLRKNKMDLNRWTSEGLFFVSFEEYAKAQEATLSEAKKPLQAGEMETKLKDLKKWIDSLSIPEERTQLSSAFKTIYRFAMMGRKGDVMDVNLPHLKDPYYSEFDTHLRSIGLRFSRRAITKGTPLEANAFEVHTNSRFFGTRLLEALVSAVRVQRKTLVIHNGFLDLAFLCCAIHQHEPPGTLKEFKQVIRQIFPVFFDTRTLTCAPALQTISNMTGPLKKTYARLQKRNRTIQLHCSSLFLAEDEENMKEHDAVFDAFMTGALFAFAQEELNRVKTDFRKLRNITPLHGCMFSVLFDDDNVDCFLHPRSSPIYLINRQLGAFLNPDNLRSKLAVVARNVSFMFVGEKCVVKICDEELEEGDKKQISTIINSWCRDLGMSVSLLDVESCISEHSMIYITGSAA